MAPISSVNLTLSLYSSGQRWVALATKVRASHRLPLPTFSGRRASRPSLSAGEQMWSQVRQNFANSRFIWRVLYLFCVRPRWNKHIFPLGIQVTIYTRCNFSFYMCSFYVAQCFSNAYICKNIPLTTPKVWSNCLNSQGAIHTGMTKRLYDWFCLHILI